MNKERLKKIFSAAAKVGGIAVIANGCVTATLMAAIAASAVIGPAAIAIIGGGSVGTFFVSYKFAQTLKIWKK